MQAIESHCVWSSGSPGTEPIVLRAMDSSREHARDLAMEAFVSQTTWGVTDGNRPREHVLRRGRESRPAPRGLPPSGPCPSYAGAVPASRSVSFVAG